MASVESLPAVRTLPSQDARDRVREQVVRSATQRGILLVKTSDLPPDGLLSERQKQWVNSATYDGRTQNPVIYKHESEISRPSRIEIDRDEAIQEVQRLPDIVRKDPGASSEGGGVGGRLMQGRKERHESTVQDMKEELAQISSECEDHIHTAIVEYKAQVTENDQVIESLFDQVSKQEDLAFLTLPELHTLWETLSSQTQHRLELIHSLDSTLSSVDSERASKVTSVLLDYTHQLTLIAYLLPCDVERVIEVEAHVINTTLLDNSKNYAQLCLHLSTDELCREREWHDRWEGLVDNWKELICQFTLDQFQAFLSSDLITDLPDLQRVRESLIVEQRGIQQRREELLEQVASLVPPKATRTMLYQLKATADKLHQELERVHTGFLLSYQSCIEFLSSQVEAEIERCRVYLISSGAVDVDSIPKVLSDVYVPLMEKLVGDMREKLQRVETALDLTLSTQKTQFESLFKHSLGAATLWDQHSDIMAATLRAFQERLEKSRSSHDCDNQNLEANLDLLLDRLRQGPTQEALKEFLQEALKMLSTIKLEYERFHAATLEEVRTYPELVLKELEVYDNALCQYLGVSRTPLKKSKSKLNVLSRASSQASRMETRNTDSRASRQDGQRAAKTKKSKPQRSRTTIGGAMQRKITPTNSSVSVGEEVITVSGGVCFYLQHTKSGSKDDSTFLTQDEESEGSAVSYATESLVLSQEVFSKVQDRVMKGLLEYLEQWKATNIDKAQIALSGKEEECHTELDLRLHLHEPRPSRVEEDIYNVRVAELIAHRDRITRHSTSLSTSLALERGAGERLRNSLKETKEQFDALMKSLVAELRQCSKMTELLSVQSRATEVLQVHQSTVTAFGADAINAASSLLDQLVESNTAYKASIKLFSEGGNYCPEEVDLFVKKLDRLSQKLSATRSHVTASLNSVTETELENSCKLIDQFNNKFELHCTDLSFLEKISRTLTSAQVKIKSEVAASNSQYQTISEHVSQLKTLLADKKSSSSQLLSLLPPLCELLTARVDYLYCNASTVLHGSRVGDSSGLLATTSSNVRPIGSMNVTKSIIEHVTKRPSGGCNGTPSDRRLPPLTSIHTSTTVRSTDSHVKDSDNKKSSRQSNRKKGVSDRKSINFGADNGGKDESESFLPKIRAVLKTTHLQLYEITHDYYKSKGSRVATTPNLIQDTFEGHIDSLTEQTQSYRCQAEEYRDNCIQEFHDQLLLLRGVLESIPGRVFSEMLHKWSESARQTRESRMQAHITLTEEDKQQRVCHKGQLRPGLGHPSQSKALARLCLEEEERHTDLLKEIASYAEDTRKRELECLRMFLDDLSDNTKKLLTLFDNVTSDSDIALGDDQPVESKHSLEQLLRRHVQGTLHVSDTASSAAQLSRSSAVTSSGKTVWPALPKCPQLLSESTKRPECVSKKVTSAHKAIIEERDKFFNEYCSCVRALLETMQIKTEEERSLENKWFDNWTQSVHRVKQLYLS